MGLTQAGCVPSGPTIKPSVVNVLREVQAKLLRNPSHFETVAVPSRKTLGVAATPSDEAFASQGSSRIGLPNGVATSHEQIRQTGDCAALSRCRPPHRRLNLCRSMRRCARKNFGVWYPGCTPASNCFFLGWAGLVAMAPRPESWGACGGLASGSLFFCCGFYPSALVNSDSQENTER